MKIGIDASNIRAGGGLTHLVEFLSELANARQEISAVVWVGAATVRNLPTARSIKLEHCSELDRGYISRYLWQRWKLSDLARKEQCDVLLIPGGNFMGDFSPTVVMCRNMLPFENRERRRYRWSRIGLRLWLLYWSQRRSFNRCFGLIFLTEYARKAVLKHLTSPPTAITVIPHGVSDRFRHRINLQQTIHNYSPDSPFNILYVSIIDEYKHQWKVAEAVLRLSKEGLPVCLTLIGPAYAPSMKRLAGVLGSENKVVKCRGSVEHAELHRAYADADLCIFASSCENMPNILLEKMASGRPIACSNRGPMPEVLGDAGVYFDPENAQDIADALRKLLNDVELRETLAQASKERVQQYSWNRCAQETVSFLEQVRSDYEESAEAKSQCVE